VVELQTECQSREVEAMFIAPNWASVRELDGWHRCRERGKLGQDIAPVRLIFAHCGMVRRTGSGRLQDHRHRNQRETAWADQVPSQHRREL